MFIAYITEHGDAFIDDVGLVCVCVCVYEGESDHRRSIEHAGFETEFGGMKR